VSTSGILQRWNNLHTFLQEFLQAYELKMGAEIVFFFTFENLEARK
jgi:hypothetical protein